MYGRYGKEGAKQKSMFPLKVIPTQYNISQCRAIVNSINSAFLPPTAQNMF